jgi:hypothetical protein
MSRSRILAVPVGAVTVSLIALVMAPGPASATRPIARHGSHAVAQGGSKVNVKGYGLDCTGLAGSLTFKPPLTQTASFSKEKISLASTLSSCASVPNAGGTPVAISSGTLSGTLTVKPTSQGITCGAILAAIGSGGGSLAITGKLSAKWTSTPSVSPSKTTITVKSAAAPFSGNSNLPNSYTIPGTTPSKISGAFSGNNSQGSLLALVSGLSPENEGLACIKANNNPNGLQTLSLGGGLVDSSVPPSSIAVSPQNATFAFSQCYSAIGTFPSGTFDLTPLASWSIGDPNIASLAVSGLGDAGCADVTGDHIGTTSIAPSFMGVAASTNLTVSRLTITTTSLPNATVLVPYNQTLMATDGTTPYHWSVSFGSLPAWATLDASTGAITGTPGTGDAGTTTDFSVQVTDSATPTAGTDSANLSITVN